MNELSVNCDSSPSLTMPAAFISQIVAQARAEMPNECCGVLGGKDGVALGLFQGRNAVANPFRYQIAAEDLWQTLNAIDQRGWDVVAIYHSHIGSEAFPSATDVELAAYPDAVYIIVSLKDRARPVVNAFRITERQINAVELRIQP